MQDKFDTYSYDGHGINGRDEYRTRLLTLTDAGKEAGIGPTVAKLLDEWIQSASNPDELSAVREGS